MAKKLKKRKILNEIREVSVYDFADDPRRKKAPKDAKYKIVFYKPKPNENSNIPKNFQGVQYYTTKAEADLALKDRLELSEKLKPGGIIIIGLYHKYGRMVQNIRQYYDILVFLDSQDNVIDKEDSNNKIPGSL